MSMPPCLFRNLLFSATVVLATTALLMPAPLSAQSLNWQLHHQGRLFDEASAPLEGRHRLAFTLFRDEVELWSEEQEIDFISGFYSASLTSLFPELLSEDGRYTLAIAVDGGPALSPRTPLRSVPFALRASQADRALRVEGPVLATRLVVG